ncbi:MAG: SpoIIE family protein phosphatase [Deltaproteobacteria bacterium]|nr:SpoIIE family protein phosphatase [Deltaproteobacteria bacterium]
MVAWSKTHSFKLFLHGALTVVVVVGAVSVLNGIKLMRTVEETSGWLREGMISSLKYSGTAQILLLAEQMKPYMARGDKAALIRIINESTRRDPRIREAAVVDQAGTVLAHNDPSKAGLKSAGSLAKSLKGSWEKVAVSGCTDLEQAAARRGLCGGKDPRIVFTISISRGSQVVGGLLVAYTLDTVDRFTGAAESVGKRRTTTTLKRTISVAIMATLAGLLLTILLAVRASKPVRTLMRQTHQIANGDYAVDVDVTSQDEVGHLAHRFQAMSQQVLDLLIETRDKGSLESELDVASAVQTTLVPDNAVVDLVGVSLAGYYNPAARCGGDWWNYYELVDGRSLVIVGDVTGHGLASAIISSAAQGAAITTLEDKQRDLDLNGLLHAMNLAIFHAAKGRFVMTCFASLYDPETRQLSFANAGHNFPYLYKPGTNEISTLVARGTRLGDVRITDFAVQEVTLDPKDAIIWYTDGITENENAEHEPYGDRRFRRVINRSAFLSAEKVRDAIIEDVTDYYGGYPLKDDVTLVVGRVG